MGRRGYSPTDWKAFGLWTPLLTNLGRALWRDLLPRRLCRREWEWVPSSCPTRPVLPHSSPSLGPSPGLLLILGSLSPLLFPFFYVSLYFLAGNFDVLPQQETNLATRGETEPRGE